MRTIGRRHLVAALGPAWAVLAACGTIQPRAEAGALAARGASAVPFIRSERSAAPTDGYAPAAGAVGAIHGKWSAAEPSEPREAPAGAAPPREAWPRQFSSAGPAVPFADLVDPHGIRAPRGVSQDPRTWPTQVAVSPTGASPPAADGDAEARRQRDRASFDLDAVKIKLKYQKVADVDGRARFELHALKVKLKYKRGRRGAARSGSVPGASAATDARPATSASHANGAGTGHANGAGTATGAGMWIPED